MGPSRARSERAAVGGPGRQAARRRPRRRWMVVLACAGCAGGGWPGAAGGKPHPSRPAPGEVPVPGGPGVVAQPDFAATGGFTAQKYIGAGAGAVVGILDAGVDIYHPALRGSCLAQADFTGEHNTDDTEPNGGHATGIAALLVGHDTGYYGGYAPAAKFLNARVVDSHDQTNDTRIGNGLFWSLDNGARVINLSLGESTPRPTEDRLNLMIDYAVERYGASFVGAVANADVSAVQDAPGGSYNGISVGGLAAPAYNQVRLKSATARDGDLRTKPDLVAPAQGLNLAASDWEANTHYMPGDGTSFAAPAVGGVLAQMQGFGLAHQTSIDPRVLKAVLMTSAAKAWRYDGTPWTARDSRSDPGSGVHFDQPLDPEQGAGRLDAVAAYRLYTRRTDDTTPYANWVTGSLRQHAQSVLEVGYLRAGERLDATMTWLRHVLWRDTNHNHQVDGGDSFGEGAALGKFSLELLRNGMTLATSDSDADNLQHLSWFITQGGDYSLRIYRFEGGVKQETYALAARVLAAPPILQPLHVTADGTPDALSAAPPGSGAGGTLAATPWGQAGGFDAGYGLRGNAGAGAAGPSAADARAVPEPAGTALGLVVLALLLGRRGRQNHGQFPRSLAYRLLSDA